MSNENETQTSAEVTSPISDEVALTAAQAMHVYDKHDPWDDEGCNDTGEPGYEFPSCKEWTTGMARAALTAALPALRRQIAEEIAPVLEEFLGKPAGVMAAEITRRLGRGESL